MRVELVEPVELDVSSQSSESSCAVRLARHSQNAWARHVERVESSRAKWNLALYAHRIIKYVGKILLRNFKRLLKNCQKNLKEYFFAAPCRLTRCYSPSQQLETLHRENARGNAIRNVWNELNNGQGLWKLTEITPFNTRNNNDAILSTAENAAVLEVWLLRVTSETHACFCVELKTGRNTTQSAKIFVQKNYQISAL